MRAKKTTQADLDKALESLNDTANQCMQKPFRIEHMSMGTVKLTNYKGVGIIGVDTGLGIAGMPKRELIDRMEALRQGMIIGWLACRACDTQ